MKQPTLNQLYRVAIAAERHGIPRTTAIAAANSGKLGTWSSACGVQMTTDEAISFWLANAKGRTGRPKRKT